MLNSVPLWENLLHQASIECLSAKYHDNPASWKIAPRVISDEILNIQHTGVIEWTYGDEVFRSHPGDVVFNPPHITWQARRVSSEMVRVTALHFEAEFPTGLRYLEVFGYPHVVTPTDFAHIERIGFTLCDLYENQPSGFGLKVRALILTLFSELWQQRGVTAPIDRKGEYVWKAITYLKENLAKPVTIESLAQECYVSSHYLSTLFQQVTGQGPISYLIKLRIEEARRLLATSELPINEIALRVGYEDAAYFSRLFKSHVGVSPRQFRRE